MSADQLHGLATSLSRRMAAEAAKDAEGRLEEGELDRVRAWGEQLVRHLSATSAA